MYSDLNVQTNKSLVTAETVHSRCPLPKNQLESCSQPLAGSCKTSVPKVAVGPPDDTSP